MAKITVFYDFHEEGIKPFTMVIKFKQGEMDWSKSRLRIPLEAPFKRHMSEDFVDGIVSAMVLLDDLTVNPDEPNSFGVYLPYVKERYKNVELPLEEIEQFVIRFCDIEEVMQMDLRSFYEWRQKE